MDSFVSGEAASVDNALYALIGTIFIALLGFVLKRYFMKKAVENEVFKIQMSEMREGFLAQIAGWKTQCESLANRNSLLESQRSLWEARATTLEQQLEDERGRNRIWPDEPEEGAIIIVAEDDRLFARMLKRLMAEANLKVFIVERGYDALRALRMYSQFRLMVLDFGLPDIGGIEVAVQARREGFKLPIIGLSGIAGHLDLNDPMVIEAGLTVTLPKTGSVSEVGRHVIRLLSEGGGPGGQGTGGGATPLPA